MSLLVWSCDFAPLTAARYSMGILPLGGQYRLLVLCNHDIYATAISGWKESGIIWGIHGIFGHARKVESRESATFPLPEADTLS